MNCDAFTDADAYNPSTGVWTAIAPLPTGRSGLAAATAGDGKTYAIGGIGLTYDPNPTTPVDTVEAYDPTTNRWACSVGDTAAGCASRRIAPVPTPRENLAAATGPDGRIYAIGGSAATPAIPATDFLNTVEAYDPATNTWTAVAPLPTARNGLAAATGPDGRIYALGGEGAPLTILNTVEAYDPPTKTWSTVAPMLTSRFALAATSGPDGRIYALGGEGRPQYLNYLNTAEVYTPPTSSTATLTATPTRTAMATLVPSATPVPPALPSPTSTPRVVAAPMVVPVAGQPGATEASFTASFSSGMPGQGEVYFGSGPGCSGLVEVATRDLHPGATQHEVVVTGNDLPGTVGSNGIIPGATYWFEVVTVTRSGVEVDTNNGQCYSVTMPT